MDRKPAVAGQFYPAGSSSLQNEVDKYLKSDMKPTKVLAAIAPHAGYIYSGGVAGKVFASIEVPKRCIVLSPNHTGMGATAAVWPRGTWHIPTGAIPVDEELASNLLKSCSELTDDPTAHIAEHSLEVELPFMLARQPELTIVPITVSRANMDACQKIGEAIADAVKDCAEDMLIVASTDMNHYESQKQTLEKDQKAIDRVLALDAEGLVGICSAERISMCGVLPTAIAIIACNKLGATEAHLIKHATSGDVSGDMSAVVGYAGFVIK
ncbi:MAG: AmmeMemoRadiSam system protein B [Pseudomonadota bacterium]